MPEEAEEPGPEPAAPMDGGADLFAEVYGELRRLAAHRMAGEAAPQTLQPTALVHEVWLRLSEPESVGPGGGPSRWRNRQHYFATAALVMRNILVDRARAKRAIKRGGGARRSDGKVIKVNPAFETVVAPDGSERMLEVDEALGKFAAVQPDKARLVELRYFAGLTQEEAAEVLGISLATAKRWWVYARAWLHDEITRVRDSEGE